MRRIAMRTLHVTPLDPEAFCDSIETALMNPPDPGGSIERIRKSLNRLPEGLLYVSSQGRKISFYTKEDGRQKYLPKRSEQIHSLARRRYQAALLGILQLTDSSRKTDIERRAAHISRLQDFIRSCAEGGLDIASIVLTKAQHNWFTRKFKQKYIDPDSPFKTARGMPVRSKSERDVINSYDDFAVPIHYEEQMIIDVRQLVDNLEKTLVKDGFLRGPLYGFDQNGIHWNVPPELQWMNARGSIWKTYDPPYGTLSVFNDVRGMFADGSIFVHEHEGMMEDFVYRCNSSKRSSIIKYTGAVSRSNFIETFEQEIDTKEKASDIIRCQILPRLWF